MKSVFLCFSQERLDRVYSPDAKARLARISDFLGSITDPEMLTSPIAREAEVAFSTWCIPILTEEELARYFPNLKAVFYGAGSVQAFGRPILNRGIRLFSAWQANGVPVAEFALAQILLSLKGYFAVQPLAREDRGAAGRLCGQYAGMYKSKVGLLGCGAVGRHVARLLQAHDLQVMVFDPFLSDEAAKALRVVKADIADIFAQCDVISNHLADLPATKGIIRRSYFMSMKPYATFINTGRGAQLDERDLYDALVEVPTRMALLDVMTNEKNSVESPLNRLPNCRITPHMAGSGGQEVWRMADYMLDEYMRFSQGEACLYEVTLPMLETMA